MKLSWTVAFLGLGVAACGGMEEKVERTEAAEQHVMHAPPVNACDPQDAAGVGACRASAGVFWNGAECTHVWGCECVGADCGADYGTLEACQAAHVSCSAEASCRTEKIGFSKEQGCLNDGFVEFCLPKGDVAVEATVKRIAPSVFAIGGGGRAQCNLRTETLFVLPTGGNDRAVCVAQFGAMTDAAWQQVCGLSQVPEIRKIVPTWFE